VKKKERGEASFDLARRKDATASSVREGERREGAKEMFSERSSGEISLNSLTIIFKEGEKERGGGKERERDLGSSREARLLGMRGRNSYS